MRFPHPSLFVVIVVPFMWSTGSLVNKLSYMDTAHFCCRSWGDGGGQGAGRWITQHFCLQLFASSRTFSSDTGPTEAPLPSGLHLPSRRLSGVVLLLGSFSVGLRKAQPLPCPLRASKQAYVPSIRKHSLLDLGSPSGNFHSFSIQTPFKKQTFLQSY